MSRRITIAVVVISTMFAQGAADALAGNPSKLNGQSSGNGSSSKHSFNLSKFSGLQQINSWQQLHKKTPQASDFDNCKGDIRPLPIDPGRGDGKPSGTDQPPVVDTIPVRPGYVWVNGHWERQRATQGTATQPLIVSGSSIPPAAHSMPVVTPSNFNGFYGNIRDHRNETSKPLNGFVIRDHRTNFATANANGGVTVTVSQSSSRNNKIPTLTGPGPLDVLGNAAQSIGSGLKDLVTTEVGDASPKPAYRVPNFNGPIRDHR